MLLSGNMTVAESPRALSAPTRGSPYPIQTVAPASHLTLMWAVLCMYSSESAPSSPTDSPVPSSGFSSQRVQCQPRQTVVPGAPATWEFRRWHLPSGLHPHIHTFSTQMGPTPQPAWAESCLLAGSRQLDQRGPCSPSPLCTSSVYVFQLMQRRRRDGIASEGPSSSTLHTRTVPRLLTVVASLGLSLWPLAELSPTPPGCTEQPEWAFKTWVAFLTPPLSHPMVSHQTWDESQIPCCGRQCLMGAGMLAAAQKAPGAQAAHRPTCR